MKSFVIAAILVTTATASANAAPPDIPVMAGGYGAACVEQGEVVGLDPHGDGFLSVESGPGGRPFFEKGRVFNGQRVAICERKWRWLGVVYDASGNDCGLATPRDVRQPYTGPCRSGWVYSRYIRELGSASTPPPQAESACRSLWLERNHIYKNAGYCFKTANAIEEFGNAGCSFDTIQDVPLSETQRRTIASLVARERELGCGP